MLRKKFQQNLAIQSNRQPTPTDQITVFAIHIFSPCRGFLEITEQRGARYSKCLILAGFTGHNKSNCKISICNKLTLHIAQSTACKNIED